MTEQNQNENVDPANPSGQPVVADPAKTDEQVRQENERLSNTRQLVITHPDNQGEAKVSKRAYDRLWSKRGWTVVEDGTGATPDQIDTTGTKDQAAFDEASELVPTATTTQRSGRPERTPKEN